MRRIDLTKKWVQTPKTVYGVSLVEIQRRAPLAACWSDPFDLNGSPVQHNRYDMPMQRTTIASPLFAFIVQRMLVSYIIYIFWFCRNAHFSFRNKIDYYKGKKTERNK